MVDLLYRIEERFAAISSHAGTVAGKKERLCKAGIFPGTLLCLTREENLRTLALYRGEGGAPLPTDESELPLSRLLSTHKAAPTHDRIVSERFAHFWNGETPVSKGAVRSKSRMLTTLNEPFQDDWRYAEAIFQTELLAAFEARGSDPALLTDYFERVTCSDPVAIEGFNGSFTYAEWFGKFTVLMLLQSERRVELSLYGLNPKDLQTGWRPRHIDDLEMHETSTRFQRTWGIITGEGDSEPTDERNPYMPGDLRRAQAAVAFEAECMHARHCDQKEWEALLKGLRAGHPASVPT